MPQQLGGLQVCVGSGQQAMSIEMHQRIMRVVVDADRYLPSMFEITFRDVDGDTLTTAKLTLGAEVQVWASKAGSANKEQLISGEVVSLEGAYEGLTATTVVRGYDKAHRLQRVRHTRTFLKSTDSAIVRKVVQEAGLQVGTVDSTSPVHEHIGQMGQSDWDFLLWRARELGYHIGMEQGMFCFRAPAPSSGGAIELVAKDNLRSFRPRITGGNLAEEVEVRVWDPIDGKAVAEKATLASKAFTGSQTVSKTAKSFASQGVSATPSAVPPGGANLGPAPSTKAYVVVDRQVAAGAQIASAAKLVASGVADHLASTFAEAEGAAHGDPALRPGRQVKVSAVPSQFAGTWTVTAVRHVLDRTIHGGYTTEFRVSGQQDRSMLALAQRDGAQPAGLPGVVCGIVSDTGDPRKLGRVKVAVPLLSPTFETDWCPVVQLGGARQSGAMFLPEVGDQVLLGFELQDPRRPYVLGGVITSKTSYGLHQTAVKKVGEASKVVQRGFVTPSGNQLLFTDDLPPSGPPSEAKVRLGSKDGKVAVDLDTVTGAVAVTSKIEAGKVTISCSGKAGVTIQTDPGVPIALKSGGKLSLAGTEIDVQSQGQVKIKGVQIALG